MPLLGEHLPVRGTNTAYGTPKAEGEDGLDENMFSFYFDVLHMVFIVADVVEVD